MSCRGCVWLQDATPKWNTVAGSTFGPTVERPTRSLPFDTEIRSSYLLNGRLPAFSPTPTASGSVSRAVTTRSHVAGSRATDSLTGTMSPSGQGVWGDMSHSMATPGGSTPGTSTPMATGYSLGIRISSKLDRMINVLNLVRVAGPLAFDHCVLTDCGAVTFVLRTGSRLCATVRKQVPARRDQSAA